MRYLLLLAIAALSLAPAAEARHQWRNHGNNRGSYDRYGGYGNYGGYRDNGSYGNYGGYRNLPPGIAKKGGWLPPGQARRGNFGWNNRDHRRLRRDRDWNRYNRDSYRDRYFDWRRIF